MDSVAANVRRVYATHKAGRGDSACKVRLDTRHGNQTAYCSRIIKKAPVRTLKPATIIWFLSTSLGQHWESGSWGHEPWLRTSQYDIRGCKSVWLLSNKAWKEKWGEPEKDIWNNCHHLTVMHHSGKLIIFFLQCMYAKDNLSCCIFYSLCVVRG